MFTPRFRSIVTLAIIMSMSSAIKTLANEASVEEFIRRVDDETKRQDSIKLLEIYTRITGEEAKMWGSSIIGFGKYHYKSERSRQEGDAALAGFSPRKQNLTLYLATGFSDLGDLLKDLGKHKTSVSCLYINKLVDVDLKVLERIISRSYIDSKKKLL